MDTWIKLRNSTNEEIAETVIDMVRKREEDVSDWEQLPQRFLQARKVDKIPAFSADVALTDNVGDISWDAAFMYILVDNAGTPTWRRIALGAF